MAKKYRAESRVAEMTTRRPACDSSAAAHLLTADLETELQEVFLALALDSKMRLIRRVEISRGTLDSCPVHPREVFRPMIQESAFACLLVHNHPSGDPEPSRIDEVLTRRLVRAGSLLGIQVLDHVIIGRSGNWVSMEERGLMGTRVEKS
jgi:DNA repair protein RadC